MLLSFYSLLIVTAVIIVGVYMNESKKIRNELTGEE